MRKFFTSLDVSGFPSLDECREQAGLTGKAAPAPAGGDAAPQPSPSPAATESTEEAAESKTEDSGDDTHMEKPSNPPPKPKQDGDEEALPAKPTGVAPPAPPTSLPTAAMNFGGNAPAGDGLIIDFSKLNFSDSDIAAGGDDVAAILNGTQTSTMDFSSFNFNDIGSGSGSMALNLSLQDGSGTDQSSASTK